MPTFQALQDKAQVQDRVNQRYAEIEQSANNNAMQGNSLDLLLNFLQNKVEKSPKQKVKWPQDYVFVGPQRTKPSYQGLNECQWFLGFLHMRQDESDINKGENMIDYVTELMQDAVDYSWEAAKGSHFVLHTKLAEGNINWGEIEKIHKMRERYAQTNSQSSNAGQKPKNLKTVPCFQYNKSHCSKGYEDVYQNLLLTHMCELCFRATGKAEPHTKRTCSRANRESKNH